MKSNGTIHDQMIPLKQLSQTDPIDRRAEKQAETKGYSPMDPPDAYAPPADVGVDRKDLHPFLLQLIEDHEAVVTELDAFESVLVRMQTDGIDRDTNQKLGEFFRYLDESIVQHQALEETKLFPLLRQRLVERGEHSQGPDARTAIDMLEDDHIKVMQLAAVTFSLLGLAPRLPDADSCLIVLDTGLQQGKALVELLRLHIFREDNVVFPLAQTHLSAAELDAMRQ